MIHYLTLTILYWVSGTAGSMAVHLVLITEKVARTYLKNEMATGKASIVKHFYLFTKIYQKSVYKNNW
jgi:hypothetical protein